jgi:hypothetical protein
MSKTVRYLIYFLAFDAVVIGGYFGFKALTGGGGAAAVVDWVTIDESYAPKNAVEEFIKGDAEVRGGLPVSLRNYGRDKKILARFKGKQFARPTENILSLFFKGLDDWMVVDIKYKNENKRDVQRTILYVFADKRWTVGDAGTLLK